MDFDDPTLFPPFVAMVEALCPGLIRGLPVVQTPTDGRHLYLRCQTIQGNLKLARKAGPEGKPVTVIETRGEGGYVLSPYCPPACHPLKKPYQLLHGDLTRITTISTDERAMLLNSARSFNTYIEPERLIVEPTRHTTQDPTDRPGDVFAARTSWEDILLPHGWTSVGHRGGVTLWRRPDRNKRGCSATTGHKGDVLYCFSTNAAPFESEHGYSKFTAFTLLNYGGDFQAAARALAAQGYGTPRIASPPSAPPASNPWAGLNTLPWRPYTGYRGLWQRIGVHHG